MTTITKFHTTSNSYSGQIIEDFETPANPSPSGQANLISGGLQEGGEKAAALAKKTAYIWLEAKVDDPALTSKERKEDREANIEILKGVGYDVKLFESSRQFFNGINEAQNNGENIDLLIFSAHGSPSRCGQLQVRGEKIVSNDSTLTSEEKEFGFESIKKIMAKDSIVVFNSCLTGNKSVQNNIAKVSSLIFSSSTIFAPQCVIYYDPMYQYGENLAKELFLQSVLFTRFDEEAGMIPCFPTQYVRGEEVTKQEAEPYVPPSSAGRRPLINLVNSVIATGVVAFVGIGAWYCSKCCA